MLCETLVLVSVGGTPVHETLLELLGKMFGRGETLVHELRFRFLCGPQPVRRSTGRGTIDSHL